MATGRQVGIEAFYPEKIQKLIFQVMGWTVDHRVLSQIQTQIHRLSPPNSDHVPAATG